MSANDQTGRQQTEKVQQTKHRRVTQGEVRERRLEWDLGQGQGQVRHHRGEREETYGRWTGGEGAAHTKDRITFLRELTRSNSLATLRLRPSSSPLEKMNAHNNIIKINRARDGDDGGMWQRREARQAHRLETAK